jgi:hypothetical protein
MTDIDINIVQAGQARIFLQADGPSPANQFLYFGCLSLGGLTQDLGAGTPVYCPSSQVRNKWDIIDSVPSVQALPTTDFTQRMDRGLLDIWWDLRKKGCRIHGAIVLSSCGRPDDINQFDSMILLRQLRPTNFALPELNPLAGDGNVPLDITGSLEMIGFDPVRSIQFGEKLDSVLLAEGLDAIYSDTIQCGECGTPSDGCQHLFILSAANSGSPGLSSQIIYSLNGGATGGSIDINTLGGLSANRIVAVGLYLVAVSQANGAHHWSLISNIEAGVTSWTRVASGYVAGKSPRCIVSVSPTRTYIGGEGGYIYLMTDPKSAVTVLTDGSVTTQNVNDIHANGKLVLSAGDSNTLMHSPNSGETFTLKTGPEPGASLTAVWTIDKNIWWVGTGTGNLYYTVNGGTTWVEATPDPSLTVINDINFADDLVGYFAGQVGAGADAARIYRTVDTGFSWHNTTPHIIGLPSAERYNTVVACDYNNVLAAGRVSAGGDGIAVIAE